MNFAPAHCTLFSIVVLELNACAFAAESGAFAETPDIPKTWDDEAVASLELPLADPTGTPKHITAEYYYRIPTITIYKTYPFYHPDKEPAGYQEWLKTREPEIAFDASKLKTKADWIKAGEVVFSSPPDGGKVIAEERRDFYKKTGFPLTGDGIDPTMRYVIREKGVVKAGSGPCSLCHTRTLPGQSPIVGAQGNPPFDIEFAYSMEREGNVESQRSIQLALFGAPWIRPDPWRTLGQQSLSEIVQRHYAIPPGALARHGTSGFSPVQIPDLIGVKNRRYLDRTGLQRHRSIGDMMRYAALNLVADNLSSYAGFIPMADDHKTLPAPSSLLRYSDEQLFALALYIYSLESPANPYLQQSAERKVQVEHGRRLFMDSNNGCYKCHDPGQGYTNNKLIAAPGYEPPADHPAKEDIMRTALGSPRRVGTDPTLTLTTRRGTGFYKVPSLLGLWYRGPFEHNGSCATLEDWFDERRLRDDYVPTGWKGPPGTKTRAVKGHEFGLDLSSDDKRALIAFLKTL